MVDGKGRWLTVVNDNKPRARGTWRAVSGPMAARARQGPTHLHPVPGMPGAGTSRGPVRVLWQPRGAPAPRTPWAAAPPLLRRSGLPSETKRGQRRRRRPGGQCRLGTVGPVRTPQGWAVAGGSLVSGAWVRSGPWRRSVGRGRMSGDVGDGGDVEVVAGSGGGDVEQPELFGGVGGRPVLGRGSRRPGRRCPIPGLWLCGRWR